MSGKSEIVQERTAEFQPGASEHKSPQQAKIERNAAIEKLRTEKEKPRTDFLLSGKGDAKEFFDVETNAAVLEELTNQDGAPKPFDEYTPPEREKFLRDGELLPAKQKEKVAAKKEAAEAPTRPKMADFLDENRNLKEKEYESALDKYESDKSEFEKQQADAKTDEAKRSEPTQEDREILAEVERESETWFTEPQHAEAVRTFPQRFQAMETALTPDQKTIVSASQKAIGPISKELNTFVLNVLARTKNMGAVYVELLRQPALLWTMNHDWTQSANWKNDPAALKLRISTDKAIRHMLKSFDRRAVSNGAKPNASPNGAERGTRTLTQAGRPPQEAAGGSSTPDDDGSSDAAWKRKDLTQEERGELYRSRKNQEEAEARRKRYPRRTK